MVSRLGNGSGFWISCAILVATGLFLGFRGERAISTVLADSSVGNYERTASETAELPDTTRLGEKSRILVAAVPGGRDPFHAPARPKPKPKKTSSTSSAPKPKPKPKPKPPTPPTLRVLLYDAVDPCLKLTLKGKTSGWLRVGDSYEGWAVTAIYEHSVQLSRAGQFFTIE